MILCASASCAGLNRLISSPVKTPCIFCINVSSSFLSSVSSSFLSSGLSSGLPPLSLSLVNVVIPPLPPLGGGAGTKKV